MRAHGDAHLAGAGDRVGDLVQHEVLGWSERVQADGVHGCSFGIGSCRAVVRGAVGGPRGARPLWAVARSGSRCLTGAPC
ncbi:Uncharacterised protein [Mycobacteroides abscessus]|nr:Uncharacterised protein [Mycobacteroides abscessus]